MIDASTIRYRISKVKNLCRGNIKCDKIEPQDNYYIVTIYGGDNTIYLKQLAQCLANNSTSPLEGVIGTGHGYQLMYLCLSPMRTADGIFL